MICSFDRMISYLQCIGGFVFPEIRDSEDSQKNSEFISV